MCYIVYDYMDTKKYKIQYTKSSCKDMLISERIYQYMDERNISQKEFANRTGISQSTISDWKRKGTNPSADKIIVICDVLNVSPYELLSGTENSKMKEYKEIDYVIVDKQSAEYEVLEVFRRLDVDSKRRLEGYMKALIDMECKK